MTFRFANVEAAIAAKRNWKKYYAEYFQLLYEAQLENSIEKEKSSENKVDYWTKNSARLRVDIEKAKQEALAAVATPDYVPTYGIFNGEGYYVDDFKKEIFIGDKTLTKDFLLENWNAFDLRTFSGQYNYTFNFINNIIGFGHVNIHTTENPAKDLSGKLDCNVPLAYEVDIVSEVIFNREILNAVKGDSKYVGFYIRTHYDIMISKEVKTFYAIYSVPCKWVLEETIVRNESYNDGIGRGSGERSTWTSSVQKFVGIANGRKRIVYGNRSVSDHEVSGRPYLVPN